MKSSIALLAGFCSAFGGLGAWGIQAIDDTITLRPIGGLHGDVVITPEGQRVLALHWTTPTFNSDDIVVPSYQIRWNVTTVTAATFVTDRPMIPPSITDYLNGPTACEVNLETLSPPMADSVLTFTVGIRYTVGVQTSDITTIPVEIVRHPPEASVLSALNVTVNSATLKWTVAGEYPYGGAPRAVSSFRMRYSETASFTEADWDTNRSDLRAVPIVTFPPPATPRVGEVTYQMVKAPLVPSPTNVARRFHVAMRSVDHRGNLSPMSNVADVTLPEPRAGAGPLAPGGVSADSMPTTMEPFNVRLIWHNPLEDLDGPAPRYPAVRIVFHVSKTGPVTAETWSAPGTNEWAWEPLDPVSSLTIGGEARISINLASSFQNAAVHDYWVGFRAEDRYRNLGDVASAGPLLMDRAAPGAIDTLVPDGATSRSFSLSWIEPDEDGGAAGSDLQPPHHYELAVSREPFTGADFDSLRMTGVEIQAPRFIDDFRQVTIEAAGGPGTVYYAAVMAVDRAGNRTMSNVARAELVADPVQGSLSSSAACGGSAAPAGPPALLAALLLLVHTLRPRS